MANAVALSGVHGKAPGQEVRTGERSPLKLKHALMVFGRSMEVANLPTFLKFGNAKKSLCYLCKRLWVATKLGEGVEGRLKQDWGPVLPVLGLKPPLRVLL